MTLASARPVDPDFMARIRAGDEQAYRELFHRHYRELCRYAERIGPAPGCAEEIVQDVFFKVWLARDRLQSAATVRAYLYTAVRNEAINRRKRDSHEEHWRRTKETELNGAPAVAPSADEDVRAAELTAAIERAIAALPPRCRQAFTLQRREHLSVAEVARRMGIAPKTVEIQISIALKHLRRSLAEWLRRDRD